MKFAYLRSQRKVIFHQKSSFPFSWFLRIERICRFARKTYFLVLRKIFSSPSPSSPNIAPRGLRKKKAGKNVLLFAMNAPILAGLFAFYAVTEFLTVVKAEREKSNAPKGTVLRSKTFSSRSSRFFGPCLLAPSFPGLLFFWEMINETFRASTIKKPTRRGKETKLVEKSEQDWINQYYNRVNTYCHKTAMKAFCLYHCVIPFQR